MAKIKAVLKKDGSVDIDMINYPGGLCKDRAAQLVAALGRAKGEERPKADDPVVTHEQTATA